MKTMKADKYIDRLEAIAELEGIYTQLDKLIYSLDDNAARRDLILCLSEVFELVKKLSYTFAPFPVLGFNQRVDIATVAYKAKFLLKQYGNA